MKGVPVRRQATHGTEDSEMSDPKQLKYEVTIVVSTKEDAQQLLYLVALNISGYMQAKVRQRGPDEPPLESTLKLIDETGIKDNT